MAPGLTADEANLDFFEKKIRPVLVEHCYECHSAGGGKKIKGGLRLDTRDAAREGGDSGPAVVPGNPKESLLLTAIEYAEDFYQMPPKGKLPENIIADFRQWIEMGASDPRDAASTDAPESTWEEILSARGSWWSLQSAVDHNVPEVKETTWSNQPVDRFLLARLEDAGLQHAGRADKRALIRRLSLVLTGLPPTPEQVAEFENDASDRAYARLVDELLASPRYGERWARHWMDVVRFAETHGTEWNYEVHHAWRYRDYLIRAFNQDIPYDQFVLEHIAGDLLTPRWNEADKINEAVLGTMFYRFGEIGHDDCIQYRDVGVDAADNQLDTVTKAFQASTVACARCHDHKLDAFSMRDYYSLMGILQSARHVSHTIDAPEVNEPEKERIRRLKPLIRAEAAAQWMNDLEQLPRYLLAAQTAIEITPEPDEDAKKGSDEKSDAAKGPKFPDDPRLNELRRGLNDARLEKWVAALKAKESNLDDPLYPWRALVQGEGDESESPAAFESAWRELSERYTQKSRERAQFNAENFTSWGNFASNDPEGWDVGGHAFRGGTEAGPSGDFAIAPEGDQAISGVFPAGLFTHALSDKLNGTLRSPAFPTTKKYLSFQAMGGKTGAYRVISNNCQLNYVNYGVFKTTELKWIKYTTLHDNDAIRSYAELITKFDNPKFPDQLGGIVGAQTMREPWRKAATDPRSFFGITRAVLHDCEDSPKDELRHMLPLFEGDTANSAEALAQRYRTTLAAAITAWKENRATDEQAVWLDWLIRMELIDNSSVSRLQLQKLITRYRKLDGEVKVPRVVPGLADLDEGFDHALFVRGDYNNPGAPVPRRFFEVLTSETPLTPKGSGRWEIAQLMASRDNPLTARVMVNRIWHHLFGTGIVKTTDDFGHLGEQPTHPELLDYVTLRFIEGDWSVKRLIRTLVMTETFRMSSAASPAANEIDPNNRLLHHYPSRRLEAEAIRDSMLLVSGRLDESLYGLSIYPFRETDYKDRRLFQGPLDGDGRRSVYIKVNLMEGAKFLSAFNIPGGKETQGRRDVTNVPAQALALLNDPFAMQQSEVWAKRLLADDVTSVAERIERMFQIALNRPPLPAETTRFERLVKQLTAAYGTSNVDVMTSSAVWKDVAHAIFNLKEFIYIR